MAITSYGHCYYILIVANLMRSGISKADDDVNACFNFAERLAFSIYQHREARNGNAFDFAAFVEEYRGQFFIKDSIINRLKQPPYGLISKDGTFRTEYMYYYFLGKFLATNGEQGKPVIELMCEDSHREASYLTLLFAIHHTNDESIIEDILLRTMCTLESVDAATLDRQETKGFRNLIAELPENILSETSVEEAREQERDGREVMEVEEEEGEEELQEHPVNAVYRILKNNKVMGQVLRNKHGNLERERIEEIVEIVADSGLRLVSLALKDEEEIARFARYIKDAEPEWDFERIKKVLQVLSFLWTMINVNEVVGAINVPEIRPAVDAVVERRNTPAYDLIGYFNRLDGARQLTDVERTKLERLLKKHDDEFLRRVLSLRTQHYMNTHYSKAQIEQSICSSLKIRYAPRKWRER